jgi:hypothetical protein
MIFETEKDICTRCNNTTYVLLMTGNCPSCQRIIDKENKQ